MKFFVVRYVHHDADLRRKHMDAHASFLRGLAASGLLRASGPVLRAGSAPPIGMLILSGADRAEVIRALAADPFQVHGVVDEWSIEDWDPVFGVFADESSGTV